MTADQGDEGELRPGEVIADKYRIEGRLGTGGIGVVYRAVQLPLERPVAVKVLHPDLAELSDQRVRFEREAKALSVLVHPHVVAISDYGIDGDRPFLVMELLEGRTLDAILRDDPLDPERGIAIMRQLLRGLASAHAKGIAHRDLKPANVFLTKPEGGPEHVKLLDFGLARIWTTDGEAPDEVALTARGVVFGTPAYMSPEQAAGSPADIRSDVYSAGALLFELLTGRRPFVGETRADLMRAHIASEVPRLPSVRPELRVRPALVTIVDTAMSKSPDQRFGDAGAMLAALDAIEEPAAWLEEEVSDAPTLPATPSAPQPPPKASARRGGGLVAAAVTAALVLGVAGAWWQSSRSTVAPPPPPPPAPAPSPPPAPEPGGPADPFATPPPEPLRPFLAMVEEGHVFESQAEVSVLYRIAREMPDDPRPLLIIAHLFVLKGWYTQAMARYERAAQRDPDARGDPRMLANLVHLAGREAVEEEAGRLVERVYGAEALDAIQAEIDAAADRPLDQVRLVRLRQRIQDADAGG